MKNFTVTCRVDYANKNGSGIIEPGTVIDLNDDDRLSEADVERLISTGNGFMGEAPGAAVTTSADAMTNERLTEYFSAIKALEPDNEEHWTEAGKPEVAALKETIEGANAKERDIAWDLYQLL